MDQLFNPGSWCGYVLTLVLLLASRVAAAQPECAEGSLGNLTLEGRIGDDAVRAFFTEYYPAVYGEIYGVFLYTATWSPSGQNGHTSTRSVHGTLSKDCELQLEEFGVDNVNATWKVRFVDFERIEGTRLGATESRVVLEPAASFDCDASRVRRFASGDWPITFEYPDGWRLDESHGRIELGCPDVERIAFGRSWISFEHVTGHPGEITLESGRRAKDLAEFRNFGGKRWYYGGDACDGTDEPNVSCARARLSVRNGMTVLQGAAYRGKGPGITNYLFILKNSWVTVAGADVDADVEGWGPVLFSGNSVLQRLVRSIRMTGRR